MLRGGSPDGRLLARPLAELALGRIAVARPQIHARESDETASGVENREVHQRIAVHVGDDRGLGRFVLRESVKPNHLADCGSGHQ
jgi:hypothetical protein